MAVQCLILSSGLKDYRHLLALASYRKAPIGVEHAFCLTPTDEDSHSATIVVLCFAIVCVCVCPDENLCTQRLCSACSSRSTCVCVSWVQFFFFFLKNALPFAASWAGQVAALLQVAALSGHSRAATV